LQKNQIAAPLSLSIRVFEYLLSIEERDRLRVAAPSRLFPGARKNIFSFSMFWGDDQLWTLDRDLKNSLSTHGGVIQRLNMLTTYLVAALFRRCMPCPESRSLFLRYIIDD
jgi:hypothetical protein